jgi:2-methylcitrate dehydratase PrpD
MGKISSRHLTHDAAAWAAGLRYADIPVRVVALAKAQAASVFASAHAGARTAESGRVLAALRAHAPAGDAPVIATGERMHLDWALAANGALGMAQDYDDYLFMGHTGHSAVWAAYLVGAAVGASGEEVVAAQVAANEIAGRLGAACVLGPQNGQLWTHIHLAGAVVAAGKLYKLTAGQMANALGIAYAQPNYGLFPGFMGPGSKLLTSVTPLQTGLMAARYAQAGLTGDTSIWEDDQGFLRHFAYKPMTSMLSGYGSAWLTETLAIKPYPGCAYIDTTIDCTLDLRRELAGDFDLARLDEVLVEASLLTMEMNRLSNRHLDEARLTPVNINFNIPINTAIALLYGGLGAEHLTEGFLDAHRDEILAAARKVRLVHDWDATFEMLNDLDGSLGAALFFGGMTRSDLAYIRLRAKRDGHANLEPSRRELGDLVRALAGRNGGLVRKYLGGGLRSWIGGLRRGENRGEGGGNRGEGAAPTGLSLAGVDFAKVRLPFRSRVTFKLSDGGERTTQRSIPRGAAAAGDLEAVAKTKLETELGHRCADCIPGAWDALQKIETIGPQGVLAAMTPSTVRA